MIVHWCKASSSTVGVGGVFFSVFTDATTSVKCDTTLTTKVGTSSTATEEINRDRQAYVLSGSVCLAAIDKEDSFLVKSITTDVPTTLGAAIAGASATSPIISVDTSDAAYAQATTMTDAMKNFVCANQLFAMCKTCSGKTCTAN